MPHLHHIVLPLLALLILLEFSSAGPVRGNKQFRFARANGGGRNKFRFAGQKRENPGFYTTRFGKRSALDFDSSSDEKVLFPADNSNGDFITTPLGRPPSRQARDIEGIDENGMPISCVYAGFRNFYICDRDEPWSVPVKA